MAKTRITSTCVGMLCDLKKTTPLLLQLGKLAPPMGLTQTLPAWGVLPRLLVSPARSVLAPGPISQKDPDMSFEGNASPEGASTQPNLAIVAQYIKDLSFENPGAPNSLSQRPQIEFGIDLQARRGDAEHFEVEMKLRVNATHEGRALFLIELAYAGLFRMQNIPEEAIQQILMIQAPHLLFPFARRIIADIARDGGMPPLMIEPIDFMALYQARLAQGVQQPMGNA